MFVEVPEEYWEEVLPQGVWAQVVGEAGCPLGWERFVGLDGAVVGLSRFGASAPGHVALEKLGITVEAVVRAARRVLSAVP
ncbi:MAG: hypothetical protein ABDI20_02360 [Candidatus Bipolaricaulaceae bacterium]